MTGVRLRLGISPCTANVRLAMKLACSWKRCLHRLHAGLANIEGDLRVTCQHKPGVLGLL